VAVVASVLIARVVRLPEPYWAGIMTLIVMQSTLGAVMGALLSAYAGENIAVFGAGIFVLGVICARLRIARNAYRYAGITLTIVMLVARTQPAWIIAIHRFFEISVGIAVDWPSRPCGRSPSRTACGFLRECLTYSRSHRLFSAS